MSATLSTGSAWALPSKKSLFRNRRPRPTKRRMRTENLKHFEESEFIVKARAEAKRKQRNRERRFVATIVTIIVALIVVAAHLTYDKVVAFLPEITLEGPGLGAYRAKPVSTFQMAGVSTGMSPKQVKAVQPINDVSVTANDITTITFNQGDAFVQVWHLGADKKRQAFRIRTSQTFAAEEERDVLAAMAVKFGRPVSDSCQASTLSGTTRCQYGWRADSIDLKADTQLTNDGRFIVNLKAEDVRLRGLVNRTTAAR